MCTSLLLDKCKTSIQDWNIIPSSILIGRYTFSWERGTKRLRQNVGKDLISHTSQECVYIYYIYMYIALVKTLMLMETVQGGKYRSKRSICRNLDQVSIRIGEVLV